MAERLRITSDGLVNVAGGNLHVGTDSATINFTDSGSGLTKHIEIGATGGGDALFNNTRFWLWSWILWIPYWYG